MSQDQEHAPAVSTEPHHGAGFGRDALDIDAAAVASRLVDALRHDITARLRRVGAAVGVSGGIDSAVALALAALALPGRVVAVLMPERESRVEGNERAREVAEQFGVETVVEDITPALSALGCYERRDAAIRRVFPDYEPGWQAKIGIPGDILEADTLNVFHLTVAGPDGRAQSKRLPPNEFLEIVAASNFKQRTRMLMLYHHAEARNYAVIGTSNRDEHELGFFVKWGDGAGDVAPIRHLYKTQVFQLARHLGIPASVIEAVPSTDTYPSDVSQQEFFYRAPFGIIDLVAHGTELGVGPDDIGAALDLTGEQVRRVIADIERKRRTTEYLRLAPIAYAAGS